ncbi:MAG: GIY-YIG nuclease family protein [bacterium]|nr:GIY-YIG nuclease family protein [bacterium]
MYFVYVLLCKNNSLYTGVTNNIERRFQEHKNSKGGHYTSAFKADKILYKEKHPDKSSALKREKQIKSWSRQQKIKVLGLRIN